jgi:hypothetical protein
MTATMRTALVIVVLAAAAAGLAACTDLTDIPETGLTGTVTRGPIQPVCIVGVPCDAPFAGRFFVRRGTLTYASFESDSAGHFEVRLAPGAYLVVPDESAPVMPGQSQEVTVRSMGLTPVELSFDTGIR